MARSHVRDPLTDTSQTSEMQRGHRRSSSLPTDLGSLIASAGHRRAQRITVRTSLVNVAEEPAKEAASEAAVFSVVSAPASETVRWQRTVDQLTLQIVGLGIGLAPDTSSSFSASRGDRNRLTIQAALGNLKLKDGPKSATTTRTNTLSPLAPSFKPSTATQFARYTHRRTSSGSSLKSPVTTSLVPSLEQIRLWKQTRDEARGTLEDEWPASMTGDTPDLVLDETSTPSSPDEPKENRQPPSPTLSFTNFDRADASKRMLTTLEKRRSGSAGALCAR